MSSYYDEKDDITRYWDDRYLAWGMNPDLGVFATKDRWFEDRFRHILGEPKIRGNMVLDYGCGNTMYAPALLRRFTYYYGVETSPAALAIADKFVGSKLSVIDEVRYDVRLIERGSSFPFPDETFDCVISITVLQHQPIPERKRIIGELKRVLRPDGIYVGLEMQGNTLAGDMPPFPEEDWINEWKPFVIVRDDPPEHPDWVNDNVWVAKGTK